MNGDSLSETELARIEETAVDLAQLAGAEIQKSLGRSFGVRYKAGNDEKLHFRDPVSDVDQRCEAMIHERLDALFPRHGILGEEMDPKPGESEHFVWAVDPIDGTANFVNGFPLFAACIGVLHDRRPVVGAVWCATSHALRPGVYHASRGGPLRFDGQVIEPSGNAAVRRRLAGEPAWTDDVEGPWDVRKTGSAGIECAFVAAGLLGVARFERPNVWDVAGGIVLVEAAGFEAHTRGANGWEPFEAFEPTPEKPDFRQWRQPLVIGEREAASQMVARLR